MVKLRRCYESWLSMESKKDLEDLKAYLGDALYDAYMKIRNKIPSPSDLNKKYPDFSKETKWDDETKRQFIKKYNNLSKDQIIKDSKEFKDTPNLTKFSDNSKDHYLYLYDKMRNFIVDTCSKYRDFSKLKKLNKDAVLNFVSNYTSVGDTKKSIKGEGARKVYEDSDWVVYHITDYNASKYYGKGTKWCLSGNYEGLEDTGWKEFEKYNSKNNIYFYINKHSEKEKYALLKNKATGHVTDIYNSADRNLGNSADDIGVELPYVEEIGLNTYSQLELYDAIKEGNLDYVKDCFNKDFVNMKDPRGMTPLMVAVMRSYEDIVEFLIKNGADVNAKNNNGATPLSLAIKVSEPTGSTKIKIIDLLKKYGAKE